jgi:predicted Ser/Thr protein kinase
MNEHPSPSELADAAHGRGAPSTRAHLDRCPACRGRVAALRADAAEAGSSGAAQASTQPAKLPSDAARIRGHSLGRYLLLDLLGQGGMGSVYLAYDAELDRKVAVKVLKASLGGPGGSQDAQARLLREAQALARVSHRNVVAVHDVGVVDDRVFVAMELIEGETLGAWAKKPRRWRELVAMYLEAGRGLAAVHAAGLVHRDFKPENVLVGRNGRVCVTDFGLARLSLDAAPLPLTPSTPPTWLESPLTQTGTVMGTPFYMSPEQHQGLVPDARSDQFSFCAALYRPLFGVPPFEPRALAAAALEAATVIESPRRSGAPRALSVLIRDPPPVRGLPSRIRRALLRGLSFFPDDRFPSMEALLAELTPRDRRGSLRWVAGGAVAAAVLSSAGLFLQHREAQARLCTGAPQRLAGAWDPSVRDRIAHAFQASGSAFAALRLDQVSRALATYASEWSAAEQRSCEATRILGDQTEAVFTLRSACLDQRLKELRELTQLLATADAPLVDHAAEAALTLPSLRPCADVAVLTAGVPLPEGPAAQAQLGAAQDLLAKGKALTLAGRYPAALTRATEATARAEKLAYAPLVAEALLLEGRLLQRTGAARPAREKLTAALARADEGKSEPLRIHALSNLAYAAALAGKVDEGREWLALGRAALRRMGGDQELEAELWSDEGTLDLGAGAYPEAKDAFSRALKLYEAALGVDSPVRLNVLANLEGVYAKLGEQKRAIALLRETIQSMGRLRGPDHPALAGPWANLAYAYMQDGQFAQAHRAVERALAIARLRYGEQSPRVASFLDLEATAYQTEGRYDAALASYRQALALKARALSPKDPDLAYSLEGAGRCLVALDRPGEGLPLLERALEVIEKDPEERAAIQLGLAQSLSALGRERARAQRLAREAERAFRAAGRVKEAAEAAQVVRAVR